MTPKRAAPGARGTFKTGRLSEGRFDYHGLERVLHEKARLSILISLMTRKEGYPFGDLKKLCNLTDGNLSRHLKALTEAGMVALKKGYKNNRPLTVVSLTGEGRKRFSQYIQELEKVVKDAQVAEGIGGALWAT